MLKQYFWTGIMSLASVFGAAALGEMNFCHAQNVNRVSIEVETGDDDLDAAEQVTFRIISKDGWLLGEAQVKERWDDRSVHNVTVTLKKGATPLDIKAGTIYVHKTFDRPGGLGWEYRIKGVTGTAETGDVAVLRQQPTGWVFSGSRRNGTRNTSGQGPAVHTFPTGD